MTDTIRIKKKPVMPERKVFHSKIYITDYSLLSELLRDIPEGINYEDVQILNTSDYWDEHPSWRLVWPSPETDSLHNKRIKQYEARLKKYTEWYNDNKDAINNELERRKRTKLLKKAERIKRDKIRLEKAEAALQKAEESLVNDAWS